VFVHFFRPARDGLNITSNRLVGKGTDVIALEQMGNSAFATRAAAGLGPYPALPAPVRPAPGSCAGALLRLYGARAARDCAVCCGQHQHDLRQEGWHGGALHGVLR